jgi:hypothetical protein
MPGGLDRQAERFDKWVASRPDWARPPIYGALIVPAIVVFKITKLWPLLALLLIIGFARGGLGDPRALLVAAGILILAMCGGAVGGLAYSLLGRPLRRVPGIGRYLAGLVSVAPYVALIIPGIRLKEGKSLWGPIGSAELFAFWVCTVLFGLTIGHVWFAPDAESRASEKPARAS